MPERRNESQEKPCIDVLELRGSSVYIGARGGRANNHTNQATAQTARQRNSTATKQPSSQRSHQQSNQAAKQPTSQAPEQPCKEPAQQPRHQSSNQSAKVQSNQANQQPTQQPRHWPSNQAAKQRSKRAPCDQAVQASRCTVRSTGVISIGIRTSTLCCNILHSVISQSI